MREVDRQERGHIILRPIDKLAYNSFSRRASGGWAMNSGKQRLLLVDDEPVLRDALARLLSTRFEVAAASSADEAAIQLASAKFDAILADHHLPGESGLQLLETVQRASPETIRILISGDEAMRVQSKRRGRLIEGFLLKPATAPEITACIERALTRRRADGA